jgi:hypothetical protein
MYMDGECTWICWDVWASAQQDPFNSISTRRQNILHEPHIPPLQSI